MNQLTCPYCSKPLDISVALSKQEKTYLTSITRQKMAEDQAKPFLEREYKQVEYIASIDRYMVEVIDKGTTK